MHEILALAFVGGVITMVAIIIWGFLDAVVGK